MSLVTLPRSSAYGQNVKPSDGAKLYFYEVGTTKLKTVYSDKAETIPLSNPVIADARGVFAATYISGLYKNALYDKNDTLVWTEDNLQGRSGDWISQGEFDSTTNSGDYPSSGNQGDLYLVTEEFDLNSTSGSHTLFVDDFIYCNKDGATGIDADWEIILGKNSRQKEVDFSSKNLIIDVTGNTTVDANADVLNVINTGGQVKRLTNVDLTFTMPTDLISGTEKSSHWYQMWTDEDGLHKLVPDLTGTSGTASAGFLVWAAGTAATDGVKAGDIVYNTQAGEGTQTTVSVTPTVDGDPIALTDDIFNTSDTFKIHQLSPTGLGNYKANIGAVYNNASGNFDDTYYTQVQKPANYSEGAGDFTVSGPAGWVTGEAKIRVWQSFKFGGVGVWNTYVSIAGACNATAAGNLTPSGVTFDSDMSHAFAAEELTSVVGLFASTSPGTSNISFDTGGTGNTDDPRVAGESIVDKKPTFHK
jgi:hypothetical protein